MSADGCCSDACSIVAGSRLGVARHIPLPQLRLWACKRSRCWPAVHCTTYWRFSSWTEFWLMRLWYRRSFLIQTCHVCMPILCCLDVLLLCFGRAVAAVSWL